VLQALLRFRERCNFELRAVCIARLHLNMPPFAITASGRLLVAKDSLSLSRAELGPTATRTRSFDVVSPNRRTPSNSKCRLQLLGVLCSISCGLSGTKCPSFERIDVISFLGPYRLLGHRTRWFRAKFKFLSERVAPNITQWILLW